MTHNLPPITIGLPFFNAENDLLDAIRSVFSQTHENWELILVDDGSTDGSLELASSIDDPRVKVYSDGQNKRLAARLNQITQLAKYDFVARMDSDDLMSPTRIERQLAMLVDRSDLDLVSTGVYSINNENKPIGSRCVSAQHEITTKSLLSGNCGILNGAVVARRDWFIRNPYDETLVRAQDANLWIQAYARDDLNAVVLNEPLYFYREDNNVNEGRILASYKIVRHSILNNAKKRYSGGERVREYLKSLVKSAVIWTLVRLGKLDSIRKRRIAQTISESERDEVLCVINQIQRKALPFK